MKRTFLHLLLLVFIATYHLAANQAPFDKPEPMLFKTEWLVVGGGPAGISAVASLLDAGVHPLRILWIDETFTVGNLGRNYANVPPNTNTNSFQHFFSLSKSLNHGHIAYKKNILENNDDSMMQIVGALLVATERFRQIVANMQERVENLYFNEADQLWHADLQAVHVKAYKVILATGSHPKKLKHNKRLTRISLPTALDKEKLKKNFSHADEIAVFGSSHSAALVLKNLVSMGCKKIAHFYKEPFRFHKKTKNGPIYPYSGLKGSVGAWASKNLPHPAITAVQVDDPNAKQLLKSCKFVIDAVGFEPNAIPVSKEYLYPELTPTQELGHHLYGVGIAFPETVSDSRGSLENAVGILSFMKTIKKQLPSWLKD